MDDRGKLAVRHLDKLLNSAVAPGLPAELADDPDMSRLHEQLQDIRAGAAAFARGDLGPEIKAGGFIADNLKEFSNAYNNMAIRLDEALKTLLDNESALHTRERTLRDLADNLRAEINLRASTMAALKESEERFKYLASHDTLTGVLNRRAFMEQARWVLSEAVERDRTCSFALMDIDNFKNLNDSYGHLAGDIALQQAVRLAEGILRKTDIMGRYGGEEFVFCFAGTDLRQALVVAERIRSALSGTPLVLGAGTKRLTASLGVATAQPDDPERQACREQGDCDDYLEYLINKADLNMYEAKKSGRNRVIGALPALVRDRRGGERRILP